MKNDNLPRHRQIFVRLILVSLSLLITLIILEVCVRIICPKPDRLEEILSILQQDPFLFWRQYPRLNVIFQGVEVATNSLGLREREITPLKDKNTYRIICLGASPTFGWGVSFDKTYPQELEKMINENLHRNHIEVINAGQIGYSSYQGIFFLKTYLLKFSPDLITVSYLINDIDRYRFYRNNGLSDKESLPLNHYFVSINNLIARSRFYMIFKRLMMKIYPTKMKIAILKRQFELAKIRVSPDDYRANLETIITICQRNNIKVVFLKMPLNLPTTPLIPAGSKKFSEELTLQAINHLRIGSHEQAYSKLKEALNHNPYANKIYYYLGCYYEQRRDYKEAESEFKKAKDYLIFETAHDGKIYSRIMEEVAYQYSIPLVDIAKAFARKNSQDLFNSSNDPIHPNSIGHRIIAEKIYAVISKFLFTGD